MTQQTYDLLTGQKRLINGAWQIVDGSGNVLAEDVTWRANPGALLMWPRQEQTAKSGYWREFFYRMQEEALQKVEPEPGVDAPKKVPLKKQKQAPIRRRVVEYQTVDQPPKPKPAVIELAKARVVQEDLDARPLISEALAAVWGYLDDYGRAVPASLQKAAKTVFADEDEDELETLLLLGF